MLYWAEGSKSRSSVEITNADVELIRTFASFLRQHFDVAADAMRLQCNLFADHVERQLEIERYWLERPVYRLPRFAARRSTGTPSTR